MFLWQCANVQQRLFPIFATSSWKFQFQRKFFKYPGEQELATISFTKWYTIKYRTKPTSRRIWLAGHMYRGRVILESARKTERIDDALSLAGLLICCYGCFGLAACLTQVAKMGWLFSYPSYQLRFIERLTYSVLEELFSWHHMILTGLNMNFICNSHWLVVWLNCLQSALSGNRIHQIVPRNCTTGVCASSRQKKLTRVEYA